MSNLAEADPPVSTRSLKASSLRFADAVQNGGQEMTGFWQVRQRRKSQSEPRFSQMKTVTLSPKRRITAVARSARSNKAGAGKIRIRRVLVPIDFSEASGQAVEYAVALSKKFDADLDLVHAYEATNPIAGLAGIPLVVSDGELEHRIRRHLYDVARRHDLLLPKDNIHAVKGRAFEEVCRLAVNKNIDLIIIPTRGNTGLKHLVLGSTAERIVRHSSCPVLVIRPSLSKRRRAPGLGVASPVGFHRIVVPIDFSGCSLKGLTFAKRLARQFGSTLILLHCMPPQYYLASEEYSRYDLPLLMGRIEKTAREQLRELVEEIEHDGIEVEADLEMGHPGQQICVGAQDRGADLIVTSTHGNTGLKHVFLGSTAEYVVRHATCAVLVVPTRERPLLM